MFKNGGGGGGGLSGVKGKPFERTPLTPSGTATATLLIPQVSAAWLTFQKDFADTLPTPIETIQLSDDRFDSYVYHECIDGGECIDGTKHIDDRSIANNRYDVERKHVH